MPESALAGKGKHIMRCEKLLKGSISSFLKLAGLSKKQVIFKTIPFPSVSCNTGMASFEKRIKVCEGEVPAACRFER